MEKRANNYIVIVIVLLLVVTVIAGAGLCYLSWSDEYPGKGINMEQVQTTEGTDDVGENQVAGEALEQAREEGRQELLDSIKEEMDANVSAEEILNGLLGNETAETDKETEAEDSSSKDASEEPGNTSGSSAEGNPAESPEEIGESNAETKTLADNTVTMEQIQISADGEYTYIKDGQVSSRKGIDVSKYQKNIDWKKASADGVEYAFIRVGCRGYGSKGTLLKDEYFHQNVKGALAQKIDVGAYFFSQALTVSEAVEEAELVIKELSGYEITYPVAVDIERVEGQKARQDVLSAAERTEVCIAFCERIKEAGYIPMVYGDLETFSELLDVEALTGYDFWICETGGTMTFPYEFAVWQYSHEGTVDGINGDTSLSISLKEW